jgi:hypothetical protein
LVTWIMVSTLKNSFFFLIVTSPIRNDQSLEFPKTYSLNCRHQNGFFYYDQWHTKISSVWRRLPQLNNGRKKGVENNCLLFLWESRHSRLWGIPSIFKLLSSLTFFIFVWPFILFKILVQICKIISYVWTLFSDKINHNKIYDNF